VTILNSWRQKDDEGYAKQVDVEEIVEEDAVESSTATIKTMAFQMIDDMRATGNFVEAFNVWFRDILPNVGTTHERRVLWLELLNHARPIDTGVCADRLSILNWLQFRDTVERVTFGRYEEDSELEALSRMSYTVPHDDASS
jgi:hypothetical protein